MNLLIIDQLQGTFQCLTKMTDFFFEVLPTEVGQRSLFPLVDPPLLSPTGNTSPHQTPQAPTHLHQTPLTATEVRWRGSSDGKPGVTGSVPLFSAWCSNCVLPSVCGSLCSRPETYLKWLKKFVNVDWWMWWYVFHSASVPTDLMLCWVLREYKSCNSLRKTD